MPKEPLTQEEQKTLLEAAKALGSFRYSDGSAPVAAYPVVLFLLDTGAHPSVLSNPRCDLRVSKTPKGQVLEWNRPKKKGHAALTRIPVSKRLEPHLQEFLDSPRPHFRQFYNALLEAVARKIEENGKATRGLSQKNLTPLALRHTFGVNLLKMTKNPYLVQQAMNCSEKTLKFYAKYRDDMIEDELRELGW